VVAVLGVAMAFGGSTVIPAAAASDTTAAEKAVNAYSLADLAADWPAAARASSGLANARARFYGLVARTEGLQPGTFKVAPATDGKVAFVVDKVTQRGNTARVQGSGTESGTAAGTAFELRISDVVLTRKGSRWLVDTYSIADTAEPTPTPLDQFFTAIPVEAKSGVLAVRFEVAKSYADPSKRTVTDGAWALTVRNVGKRGVATFSQMTARSAAGKVYSVARIASPTGPALQISGDHTFFARKLQFGTDETLEPGSEAPMLVWTRPGAFNGGSLDLTYTVDGAPVTVTVALPAVPYPAGYSAVG